jgi:hypothetical protein
MKGGGFLNYLTSYHLQNDSDHRCSWLSVARRLIRHLAWSISRTYVFTAVCCGQKEPETQLSFFKHMTKICCFPDLTTNIQPKLVHAKCLIGMEEITCRYILESVRGGGEWRGPRCWIPADWNRWVAFYSHTLPLV